METLPVVKIKQNAIIFLLRHTWSNQSALAIADLTGLSLEQIQTLSTQTYIDVNS
jgi:hypothetical protein